MLPGIIDDSQSAFLKERMITDDAIVGIKAFHLMKIGGPLLTGDYIAVKLEMMKVHDKVGWRYLEWMIWKMRFPSK